MRETILGLIAEQFNVDVKSLNDDTSFMDDLNADSIDIVELVMSLEDEFDVQIDDEVLQRMNTIGDVIEYIEELDME